jgi:pilus assembly protein CpaB
MGGRYKYVFWVALFVAAMATFGAYRYLQANSGPAKVETRAVVVAKADIPEGAAITREQVATTNVALSIAPVGSFAVADSVIGRVARVAIFNGETIVPGRLAPVGTGPGIELKIPPGKRAMAVRINDVAGISGLIQPNSRVDVLVTLADQTTNKQVAKLFMENMQVLSVGTEIQRDAAGKPNTATTATLAVTPDEAERLAIAMNTGSIQLVLRGYGDPAAVTTSGANSSDVLSQLRGGRPVQTIAPASPPASPPRVTPRSTPRPAAPAAPPVVIPKAIPPDSATVNVYRKGNATPQKFDTTSKH